LSETTLAHYEIIELLGRGGMGEVHRARDAKLGREVALKLLPEDLARDPERLARFRREAQVLASLQHPNIASIFGLEEAGGRPFLVMELAEGQDLSARIAKGPIPEDEVLDIARQIAAGLEEAHEKGVVHRDLKPANIKLGTDGKVKILDFGLARAFVGETASEENLENSPTITAAMSRGGVILGTAAYMSPEQARGKKVDRRADIWAFGLVVFEMLSGKRLFQGETVSDTLAAVLRAEIDYALLPESTSPGMRRLLERCLERDSLRRLRDVGEARIFLEDGAKDSSILASATGLAGVEAGKPTRTGLRVRAAAVLALACTLAGLGVGWLIFGPSEPPPVLNTAVPPPHKGAFYLLTTQPGPAALSPDGSMIVYSGRDAEGQVRLYLRRLDSPDATSVSGTDRAAYPFWSPDNRHIAFMTGDKLKKIAVTGGPPVTLCAANNLKGGTWNADDVILFAPDHQSGIQRVSATGGEVVAVTAIPEGGVENSHRHPRFLTDGRHFLFLARLDSGEGENRVYLGDLEGEAPKLLTTSQVAAEYSAGHLLTVREGTLLATPFDPGTGELGEGGVPLVEDLLIDTGGAWGVFSPTPGGMLLYQIATGSVDRMLEWIGSGGAELGELGEPGDLFRPRVSPDGSRAVVEVTDPDNDTSDLWIVDLNNGLRSRFTFDPGWEFSGIWTPDGRSVIYTAEVDSLHRIVMHGIEGLAGATVLYESNNDVEVTCVSPDGGTVLFQERMPETGVDIFSLDIETGTTTPVLVAPETQAGAMYSPDGRWFAHFSEAPSVWEVFVRPTAGGERKWQLNRESAAYPFWGPDGTELFYIEADGDVVSVPVDGTGTTFRFGAPRVFTRTSVPDAEGLHVSIHPDGKRILHVGGTLSEDETGYMQLVTDWRRGLVK
jgi:Tol biopolymer transport system component